MVAPIVLQSYTALLNEGIPIHMPSNHLANHQQLLDCLAQLDNQIAENVHLREQLTAVSGTLHCSVDPHFTCLALIGEAWHA
jgi:hypothetical protein